MAVLTGALVQERCCFRAWTNHDCNNKVILMGWLYPFTRVRSPFRTIGVDKAAQMKSKISHISSN